MADLGTLTPDEALKMKIVLVTYFPWLDTDDEARGTDTVDAVIELHHDLERRVET
jgi:hypothetical protein